MNRAPLWWALCLALCLGGCFPAARAPAPAPLPAMPLTPDNVAACRKAVEAAKAGYAAEVADKAGLIRMVRVVYVDSWKNGWSAPDTVALALDRAGTGDRAAKAFLAATILDLRLAATLTGLALSRDDWRDVHARSGLATPETFARFDRAGP